MLAILNSLNAHNFPIFQPILMILVSKFMIHRALFNKIYLLLGLLSPLMSTCALFFIGKCSIISNVVTCQKRQSEDWKQTTGTSLFVILNQCLITSKNLTVKSFDFF